ncbi:MAG: hypothetical protein F6K18_15185 [Okeania sp. SIO2C2]|nr:hypothetical protein [Okeania sp. SIO2C2]
MTIEEFFYVQLNGFDMKNLEAILTAVGGVCSNVVKTTIFLKDINDFATVNIKSR